jgi:benzoyl-CoA reductase/2-hydroxyglutaryl-CoA dehydratase subunit BcrC/BadD/HgdB
VGEYLKSRDEAFLHIAEDTEGHPWRTEPIIKVMQKIIKEFKVDGVLLQHNRHCEWSVINGELLQLAIEEMGTPVITLESNMADPNDYSQSGVKDRLEAFFERLGLREMPVAS